MSTETGARVRKRVLQWIVLLGLLALFYAYYRSHESEFPSLRGLSTAGVVLLFVLESLFIASNSAMLVLLAKANGRKVPFVVCFALVNQSSLANAFLPLRGGAAIRAVYLRQKFQVGLSGFVAFMTATFLLNLFLVGLVGLALVPFGQGPVSPVLIGLLALGVLAGGGGLAVARGFARWSVSGIHTSQGWWKERMSRIARVLVDLEKKPGLAVWVVGLLLLNLVLPTLSLKTAYWTIGDTIGWKGAYLIQAMGALSLLIALTPGNLGIREGAMALAAGGLGSDFETGLVVAGLLRLINLAALAVWAGVGFLLVAQPEVVDPNQSSSSTES